MALHIQRQRARHLRASGKSISDIAISLSTSKSTVSHWCRDIVLTKAQLRRLAAKQRRAGALGRLRAAEIKRSMRLVRVRNDMKQGADDIARLSKRDLFMLGTALYWGEGYKNGNEECGLTNSDPLIIKLFIVWLQRIYAVHAANLILRISINETHRTRKQHIEKYWSDITGIPVSQFTKTSFIRARNRKVFANSSQYFGTLRVKVRRGTSLRRRILGSIAEIGRQVSR